MDWINEAYRCPVVMTARTGDGYESVYEGGAVADGADPENLWVYDGVQSEQSRMFAHDFTDGFLESGTDKIDGEKPFQHGAPIVLGYFESGDYYGPKTSAGAHTWDSTEVTPSLFGLSGRDSTYNVIHAVAQIECNGQLDNLNAYDAAVLSAGLYHWTLPQVDDAPVDAGELCGFLSYLKSEYPDAYEKTFRRFGADVDTEWGNEGEALFTSLRKYVASVEKMGPDGFERMPTGTEDKTREEAIQDWYYFRSWHWYYRFIMASRTIDGFQEACYEYARMRVEDILSVSWENPLEYWPEDTTIGDVFTSEKAVAMLLRWHVLSPGTIVDTSGPYENDNLTTVLESVREEAPNLELDGENVQGGSWTCDPTHWTDVHESVLIEELWTQGENTSNKMGQTLDRIRAEERSISVSDARDSFRQ